MIERFPRRYDRDHHFRLHKLYGELVPPFEDIRVRRGLHGLVDDLFAQLGRLRADRGGLRVIGIETRAACWLVISTTGMTAEVADVIADIESSARATCEHCGELRRTICKIGPDALAGALGFQPPGLEPLDRMLCLDCAREFQKHTAGEAS